MSMKLVMPTFCPCHVLLLLLLLSGHQCHCWSLPFSLRNERISFSPTTLYATRKYDYDLIIIGAGASGLFASGAASSLGSKTLLLDQADGFVGGDCSNAACVPSKAMHSIARMASNTNDMYKNGMSWLDLARRHSTNTVMAVRNREDPSAMVERNPNLDLVFVKQCHFVSPHELELVPRNATNIPWRGHSECNTTNDNKSDSIYPSAVFVSSKKFLIATGASPIVPTSFENAARNASVPLYTYRTLFQPNGKDDTNSIWKVLQESTIGEAQRKNLVIAGGGPTACELGQSLARLGENRLNVTIVAPAILPSYDVTLQRAAMKLLTKAEITLVLRSRVTNIRQGNDNLTKYVEVEHGRLSLPVDALLLCLGRSPESSLSSLNLDAASVEWNTDGVQVNKASLQSISASNVYASGDCCDAVKDRRAGHAAWTGFHAARNTVLPFWLRVGSQAINPTVPAVIYTDPELASVGLSYTDCVRKYGKNGFQCLYVSEEGMDRADMDRLERAVIGFVELRATAVTGRVLGMTACGPAAAELANEVAVAIVSKLTVRDMARALHSYPSHGYLLYRIALAMVTSSVSGLLSSCGPVGKLLGGLGRMWSRTTLFLSTDRTLGRRKARRRREWEAEGSKKTILYGSQDGIARDGDLEDERIRLLSFLELYSDEGTALDGDTKDDNVESHLESVFYSDDAENMAAWIERKLE